MTVTAVASPTPAGTPTPLPEAYEEEVYDESLSPDWSLANSHGMSIDVRSTVRALSSTYAISLTPQVDFSTLYFTLRPNSRLVLTRENVLAISMYVNGGAYEIGTSDLAVSLRGSNTYTYWVASDNSVPVDDMTNFSETRLYDLEITHAIPPDTWVQVIVYPDKLLYDPDYKYVTGFYLKTDQCFCQTIAVDRVTLLLVK